MMVISVLGVSTVAIIMLVAVAAQATVYQVGDSTGWTSVDTINYKKWAATKTFRLGNVIVFVYTKFHNVMQVTREDYDSCNKSSPITTYASGNDSIRITKHGHHYYICGFFNHCESGQKVDINVPRPAMAPSTSDPPPSQAASSPANRDDSATASSTITSTTTQVAPVKGLLRVVATALLAILLA